MAKRKLSKGKHKVRMKNCKGKMCDRWVLVDSKGKWKFIKSPKKKK